MNGRQGSNNRACCLICMALPKAGQGLQNSGQFRVNPDQSACEAMLANRVLPDAEEDYLQMQALSSISYSFHQRSAHAV